MAEFLAECAVYGYNSTMGAEVAGKTKVSIMWGRNIAESREGQFRTWLEAKKSGIKTIAIDPRLSATVKEADIWVQLRPGTDGALA